MRDIILGGLLLPLRLYLQPRAFREQVAALAPDLPERYSLWQARHKLRDPAFRLGLRRLGTQSLVALVWPPPISLAVLGLLSLLGYQANWALATVGMAGGAAFGVVSVVVGVVAVSVAFDVAYGIAIGVASGVAFGVAGVVALGVMGDMAGGVAFGVAGVVAFGAALGVVGVLAFGVALGVALGVAYGVVLNVASGAAYSMAVGVVFGVVGVVAFGVVLGVAFGAAAILVSVLAITHAFNLPLEYVLGLATWLSLRLSPRLAIPLRRLSPTRWDEVILLPLPGLVPLLVTLYRADPALGRAALAEVAAHRYQRRAAHKALVQLANEDARLVTSAPTLAAFQRGLAWLSEDVPLPDEVRTPVLRMRDVSREVASALASDSATNRLRRLEAAADLLENLRLQPGAFGPALGRWSEIVAAELEDARRQQRIEEPIPQVYISDGRPIRPGHRPESAVPFKGRATLFRQLETALGGGEGQRTTLLLYGQRRTGKTSVLFHLPRRLGSRVVPAFVDLQSEKLGGAENVAGLLRGLADEVVDEARRQRDINLPAIDAQALAQDPYPALGRWLDQVEEGLGQHTLLLCLDEFEALEYAMQDDRLDRRILDTLRNMVQHRQRIAVLLSGSHQIDELSPQWASALISTHPLSISFLDEGDARELIEEPVAGFPGIYAPATVERILQATHCQPFLVQLACALLVERMNAARRMPPESYVEVEDVEAVIPLALERGQNYFSDLWHNQTGSEAARRLLEALARDPGSWVDSAKLRVVVPDVDALREAVGTLCRREIIERTDGGYRITVPLVAEYIRQRVLV